MQPTRRSQPYRKHSDTRAGGPALAAMLKGRAAYAPNPMQVQRDLHRTSRHLAASMKKRRGR